MQEICKKCGGVWTEDGCKCFEEFVETLFDDPMTSEIGAPVGEIIPGQKKSHFKRYVVWKEE